MTDATRLSLFPFSQIIQHFNDLPFGTKVNFGEEPRLTPIFTILNLLKELNCNAVIQQYPVQDPDYSAEYNKYYSKTFSPVDRYCHRFHFFTADTTQEEDCLGYIDRISNEAYLGFVTIRPIRSSPVATTIIKPLGNGHYILSNDKFPVNLAGRRFDVTGTPFMQQDNAVGACAQASIWMALRTQRKREGLSAYDPAQITHAATKYLAFGRVLPNRGGLTVNQIIEAIREAGYSTHIINFNEKPGTPLDSDGLCYAKKCIYSYVESEIPVVLGVYPKKDAGHAVLAIGHAWTNNHNPNQFKKIPINNCTPIIGHASGWIDSYIVHNDNTGPYQIFDDSTSNYCLNQVAFIVPLLPNDVFITGEEALILGESLLSTMLKAIPLPQGVGYKNIVTRTFLTERSKLRTWARECKNISPTVRRYYRLKEFPRRVWLTEINLMDDYGEARNNRLLRAGEIVIDPTGDPNDVPLLSAHINIAALTGRNKGEGIIFDQNYLSQKLEIIPLDDDDLYSVVNRNP